MSLPFAFPSRSHEVRFKLWSNTLTGRICMAALVALATITISAGVALYQDASAIRSTRDALDTHHAIANALSLLELDLSKVQVAVLNYKLTSSSNDIFMEQQFARQTHQDLETLKPFSSTDPLDHSWSALQKHTENYVTAVQEWSHRPSLDRINPVIARLGALGTTCQTIKEGNEALIVAERSQMQRLIQRQRFLFIATAGLIASMFLMIVGYTASMLKPIQLLLDAIRRMKEGDFDLELTPVHHGEMRDLLMSFNQMMLASRYRRQRLIQDSVTDGLTGLYNQRHFRFLLSQEIEHAKTTATQELSLLMIDIDHFKEHNDSLGHEYGNRVIQTVAEVVKAQLRATDVLSRYGGDELAAILPGASAADAQAFADRIVFAVSNLDLLYDHSPLKRKVTLSIGGVSLQEVEQAESLIESADEALYAAKHAGRDCVRWAVSKNRWVASAPAQPSTLKVISSGDYG